MRYLNALNLVSGVGPQKIKRLLDALGTPKSIWQAEPGDLRRAVGDRLAEKIIFERRNIDPDSEWAKLEKENIKILTPNHANYPLLLKEIHNPPYMLYVRGETDFINLSPMISIVGSRKYTRYGADVAQAFARDMARARITVVSGMAIGIDTFAHRGALEADGKTIAVLGNGLDDLSLYPRINFNLSREIMDQGCLLSDYPIGTQAGVQTFPARNRIIAGLTIGTLVVEAGEKSGALITAELALENNREVFSVPGPIFSPSSSGTHALIKRGARLVTSVGDILEELSLFRDKKEVMPTPKMPDTEEEKIILEIISSEPTHIDNIAKLAKLQTATVSSILSMMEIKGWTKNIGGQNYISI